MYTFGAKITNLTQLCERCLIINKLCIYLNKKQIHRTKQNAIFFLKAFGGTHAKAYSS